MTEAKLLEIVKEADDGCTPYYDVLPKLIRERGYQKGIEIGVLFGGHAKAILEEINIKLLIGIDPYKMYEQGILRIETQEDFDCIYSFVQKRLDSDRHLLLRLTSDDAYPRLMGGVYDFIFIDGLHTYDQIKRDLNDYSTLIRKGGVIACHDYNHPSFPLLTTAIDEFASLHNTEVVICPFHFIYMEKTW